MIWFWIPVSLVIMNDVAAYVCGSSFLDFNYNRDMLMQAFPYIGMLFGRHQLIKLSPKKTVEGFVGAFFVTVIFAVGVSFLFSCEALATYGKSEADDLLPYSGVPSSCDTTT